MRAMIVLSFFMMGCSTPDLPSSDSVAADVAPDIVFLQDEQRRHLFDDLPRFEAMAPRSVFMSISGHDGAAAGQVREMWIGDSDITLCDFDISSENYRFAFTKTGLYADLVDIFQNNIDRFETIELESKGASIDPSELKETDFILWKSDETTIKLLRPSSLGFTIFDPYETNGTVAYQVIERVNRDQSPDDPPEKQCLVFG